ncbi:carboxymuconolactone decarboxylase family protein [Ferrovibrio sp.]|uniref:carboxymuconolactone decarboxylase family protein n=1 Tax=Ferrovibrio sp. TaxID=1917215 RepID=UPI00311DDD82
MARLQPLSSPYPPETAAALAAMPADLALFRTVAHNPRVLSRWRGGGLLDRGSITLRQRELVILRITARLGAEYEWGVHVAAFATKAGFTAAELAATVHGDAASWQDTAEGLLVALADALIDTATVDDALWQKAAAVFSPAQLIEILALAGFYHLVSFTVNATGVEREPGTPGFPPAPAQ